MAKIDLDRVPLEGKDLEKFLKEKCTKVQLSATHRAFLMTKKRYVLGVLDVRGSSVAYVCKAAVDIDTICARQSRKVRWYHLPVTRYEEVLLDKGLIPSWTI